MGFNKNAKLIPLIVLVLGLIAALGMYWRVKIMGQFSSTAVVQAPTVIPSAVPTVTPVSASATAVNLPPGWTTYTDPDFHLTFGYPASWTLGGIQEMPGGPGGHPSRTVGFSDASSTGFFRMGDDIVQQQVSLDDVVQTDCNHLLQPCGAKPIIQTLTVAGQEARLVWPSIDSRGNPNSVYLYLTPPTHCGLIYIEVAKDYAREIIQTMNFRSVPSPEDICSLPTPTYTRNDKSALRQSPPPAPPPPAP